MGAELEVTAAAFDGVLTKASRLVGYLAPNTAGDQANAALMLLPEVNVAAGVSQLHLKQRDIGGTTYTNRITWAHGASILLVAMVVDFQNAVHVALVRDDGSTGDVLMYLRFDRDAFGVYTLAVEQTIKTFATTDTVESVDIAVPTNPATNQGLNTPVISYQWIDSTSKRHVDLTVRRASDSVWTTTRMVDQTATAIPVPRFMQSNVAADWQAVSPLDVIFTYQLHELVGGTPVEKFIIHRVAINFTTGAVTDPLVLYNTTVSNVTATCMWRLSTNTYGWVAAGAEILYYAEFYRDPNNSAAFMQSPHGLADGGRNSAGFTHLAFSTFGGPNVTEVVVTGVTPAGRVVSARAKKRTVVVSSPITYTHYLDVTPPHYLDGLALSQWASSGSQRTVDPGSKLDILTWSTVRDKFEVVRAFASTPTSALLAPANGATVTTDLPVVSFNLSTAETAPRHNVFFRVDIASDVGFNANLRSFLVVDDDDKTLFQRVWAGVDYAGYAASPLRVNGLISAINELFQGTWYIRARAETEYGGFGSYSPTHTFTVAHPPSAGAQSPSGGAWRAYSGSGATLDWTFDDTSPRDVQTAYQIIVERNDTLALVTDTGKVAAVNIPVGGVASAHVAIPSGLKEIDLRWRIKLWDSDDVGGAYSGNALFRVGDVPGVVIATPTEGGLVATPRPNVTWTFTTGSSRVPVQYRVIFRQAGTVVHDTGYVVSTAANYTPPFSILDTGLDYTVEVRVTDSGGFEAVSTRGFSVLYTLPATVPFTHNLATYATQGYVGLDWTPATPAAGTFVTWRVYRRISGQDVWDLIFETFDVSVRSYNDYMVGSMVGYEYAVTQSILNGGSVLESAQAVGVAFTAESDDYWLIHPTDPALTTRLFHVTEESFAEEWEQEMLLLIGRGRKSDRGTRFGYVGSLTAQLWDQADGPTARQQRLNLEALQSQNTHVYLRNPFGDIWRVSTGEIAVSRMPGVGRREFASVSIPYSEVFAAIVPPGNVVSIVPIEDGGDAGTGDVTIEDGGGA